MAVTTEGPVNWQEAGVLVTGGTGSFGHKFVELMLTHYRPRRLVVFSRDELKQSEMAARFDDPSLRFFLGDVRDRARLERAMHGIDVVFHAAALTYGHPYYAARGYARGLCPRAEVTFERLLSLPLFPAMSEADVDDVLVAVRKVLEHYRR